MTDRDKRASLDKWKDRVRSLRRIALLVHAAVRSGFEKIGAHIGGA